MAIVATNTTVVATAGGTRLAVGTGGLGDPTSVKVHNRGAPIWLGGSGVTVAAGLPLATNATETFSLTNGEALYAIANTATTTVTIFQGRQ